MICFSPFEPFLYPIEAYLASTVMFWTALCGNYHKNMADHTEKVCSLRNYCCVFGQICEKCRHVNLDFDETEE